MTGPRPPSKALLEGVSRSQPQAWGSRAAPSSLLCALMVGPRSAYAEPALEPPVLSHPCPGHVRVNDRPAGSCGAAGEGAEKPYTPCH